MSRQFFDATVMIPPAWQAPNQRVYIFNPAIICLAGQWVLSYRVEVKPGGQYNAICRLDDNLRVQPETVQPLADSIENGGRFLEDPRLLSYRGLLWLYYCHRVPEHPNRMVLVSLDPATLQPTAPARPFVLTEPRQWTEKNWLLFVHGDELYAVYRTSPHVILHLDLSSPDAVYCRPVHCITWDDGGYARRYGELRGGTPPVQLGDYYYSFFHSWYSSSRVDRLVRPPVLAGYRRWQQWTTQRKAQSDMNSMKNTPSFAANSMTQQMAQRRTVLARLLHRYRCRFEQRWYVAGFYAFAAQPPFAPVCFTPEPILEPHPSDQRLFAQSLNPYVNRVIFPTGAVFRADGEWVVSYGVNDEQAAFTTFSHQALLRATVDVRCRGSVSL